MKTSNEAWKNENYEVVESVGGGFILLIDGFQKGGKIDNSGSGDRVFETKKEAIEYLISITQAEGK